MTPVCYALKRVWFACVDYHASLRGKETGGAYIKITMSLICYNGRFVMIERPA
jgi:hypothetical protein